MNIIKLIYSFFFLAIFHIMTSIEQKIMKGLNSFPYKFIHKPLVLGGLNMEYYGLRETTHDYDYMVSPEDWKI